jgi:MFS family permease
MALGGGFRRLWVATVASNLGDGLVLAAFPLLAASVSRSPKAVAGLAVAAGLPWLAFGPFAGAIVDRIDRLRLMIGFDAGRACVVGGLALAVFAGQSSLVALYAVVFLIGLGETIVDTASQAVIPALVDPGELDRANGRLFATQTVAQRFLGPPLGGYLFAVAASVPIVVDSVSFFLAALVVATIPGGFRAAGLEDRARASIRAETAEGLRWLLHHPPIRAFAIGAAVINIGVTAGEAVLVLFAQDVLHLSEVGFGLLIAAMAVGYTAGAAWAPWITVRMARRIVVLGSVGLIASSLAVVAAGLLVPTFLAVGAIGVASGLWDVIAVSYRQAAVPDQLMGRIMSAYRVIAYGAFPIGALAGATIANLAGLRAPFAFGAALTFLLIPFLWSSFSGVELDPASLPPAAVTGPDAAPGSAETSVSGGD